MLRYEKLNLTGILIYTGIIYLGDSMRTQYKPRVVVSVDRHDNTPDQNARNYIQFRAALVEQGIKFFDCRGVFEGREERSFLIDMGKKSLPLALGVLSYYNQDSILIIDSEGGGTLLHNDEQRTMIGHLKVTNMKPQGDYTYVPEVGEYFTFQ